MCRYRRRPGGPPATASKGGGDRAGAGILIYSMYTGEEAGEGGGLMFGRADS